MNCPLCGTCTSFEVIYHYRQRDYLKCPQCDLVFVDPSKLLVPLEEKTRYEQHQNHIRENGYEAFLNKLIIPLCNWIEPCDSGLDYGSGPYPMLKELMAERGYQMDYYDPFFEPCGIKKEKYHFITSTEVIEHFYYPGQEFQKIFSLLSSGGVLAMMTGIYNEKTDFKSWHYIQDDTHVSFYSLKTFDWLAKKFAATSVFQEKNVVIFKL